MNFSRIDQVYQVPRGCGGFYFIIIFTLSYISLLPAPSWAQHIRVQTFEQPVFEFEIPQKRDLKIDKLKGIVVPGNNVSNQILSGGIETGSGREINAPNGRLETTLSLPAVPGWIASDEVRKSISNSGVALSLFQEELSEGAVNREKTIRFLDGLIESNTLRMIKRRYLGPNSISESSRIVFDDSIEKRVYGPDDRISPARLRGISLDPTSVPVSAYVGGSSANEKEGDTRVLSKGTITLPILLDLSKAVGILVSKDRLAYSSETNDFSPVLLSQMQQNNLKICRRDSFSTRLALGYCTAFLAKTDEHDGRNILVTAGHCAVNKPENTYVVFGFEEAKIDTRIPQTSVFEVREFGFYSNKENDTAVVRLKSPVPEEIAEPIELSSDNLKVSDPVCFIGHPDGTAKVAGCGTETLVTSLQMDYFEASVDTNQGNSGSPIIDANTHKAIGILVSGGRDYVYDKKEKCYISDVVPLDVSSFERISYTNWVEGRINSFQ